MRGKHKRLKERGRTKVTPTREGSEIIEQAHINARVQEHREILKGDGRSQKGLITEVDELKAWMLETKTTQRIIALLLGGAITLAGGATTYAVTKLTEAVINRPVVVQSVRP